MFYLAFPIYKSTLCRLSVAKQALFFVDEGLLGNLLEGCRRRFDVRQGCEGAGAETAGAALVKGADGLVSKGSAVETRAGEQAELLFEDDGQLGRFEAVDGDAEDADTLIRIGGAIDGQAIHPGGLFQKRSTELLFVAAEGFDTLFQNITNPFAEAGDAEGVVAAGLEAVGHEIRLGGDFAFTAGPPFFERLEPMFQSGPDIQGAGTERSEEGFVAGEGQQVHVDFRQIDGNMADGLGGIDQIENFVFFGDAADGGDILEGAADVAAVDDGDEPGVGPNGTADIVGINQALPVGGNIGNVNTQPLMQGMERPQDGIVLHAGGDNVVAGPGEDALDGQDQAVGAVEGHDDVVGLGAVEQAGDAFAGFVDDLTGFDGFLIRAAAGGGSYLMGIPVHGLMDGFGLGETGGGVIEIDSSGHILSSIKKPLH